MIKRNPEVANQPLFFAKISEVSIRYSFTSYRNKYKIERNKECSGNWTRVLKFLTQYERKELNPTYIEVWFTKSIERNKCVQEIEHGFQNFLLNLKERTKSVREIELERKAWKLDNPPKKSGFLVGFLNFSRFLFALSILYEQYWILWSSGGVKKRFGRRDQKGLS